LVIPGSPCKGRGFIKPFRTESQYVRAAHKKSHGSSQNSRGTLDWHILTKEEKGRGGAQMLKGRALAKGLPESSISVLSAWGPTKKTQKGPRKELGNRTSQGAS